MELKGPVSEEDSDMKTLGLKCRRNLWGNSLLGSLGLWKMNETTGGPIIEIL